MLQTSIEGVNGPVEPGSFAARQHPPATDPRQQHAAPPVSLLAHHARVRLARHRGLTHGSTELPYRDAQGHGPKSQKDG